MTMSPTESKFSWMVNQVEHLTDLVKELRERVSRLEGLAMTRPEPVPRKPYPPSPGTVIES